MGEAFIRFENVEKIYGSGEGAVRALHDASFTIGKGEICVIVGPSGAGKTTLLNILGGMLGQRLHDAAVWLDHASEHPRRHGHPDERPRLSERPRGLGL